MHIGSSSNKSINISPYFIRLLWLVTQTIDAGLHQWWKKLLLIEDTCGLLKVFTD